jgi:hypothetical protein
MPRKERAEQTILEVVLVLICLALCCLLYKVGYYRLVVLNLFYLPVTLAAFFLGRYRAGILAFLSVVCAAVVMALSLDSALAYSSPLAIALGLTIWAAVMGITAILVGTVSDERTATIEELHDAYLGVVEVLAQYLNSADPRLGERARSIAEMSQKVAARMRLSSKEIDDIRVAALLQDIDNIEVTARVIRKAMGEVNHATRRKRLESTFNGSDLVQSLGSVLTGALPLLVTHGHCLEMNRAEESHFASDGLPLGAQVIRTVRRYLALLSQDPSITSPRDAIDVLKNEADGNHHPAVLHALDQVILASADAAGALQACSV